MGDWLVCTRDLVSRGLTSGPTSSDEGNGCIKLARIVRLTQTLCLPTRNMSALAICRPSPSCTLIGHDASIAVMGRAFNKKLDSVEKSRSSTTCSSDMASSCFPECELAHVQLSPLVQSSPATLAKGRSWAECPPNRSGESVTMSRASKRRPKACRGTT